MKIKWRLGVGFYWICLKIGVFLMYFSYFVFSFIYFGSCVGFTHIWRRFRFLCPQWTEAARKFRPCTQGVCPGPLWSLGGWWSSRWCGHGPGHAPRPAWRLCLPSTTRSSASVSPPPPRRSRSPRLRQILGLPGHGDSHEGAALEKGCKYSANTMLLLFARSDAAQKRLGYNKCSLRNSIGNHWQFQ